MNAKKIFIILGHPDWDSYCGYLAKRYEEAALEAGHDVRRMNLGELQFDPILKHGYKSIQKLEPDLISAQENITWADHLVIIFPIWWGSMPALLKGFFERLILPGFAYRMRKSGGLIYHITKWLGGNPQQMLLTKKSAHIINTMDTAPYILRILIGNFSGAIEKGLLGFCGIKPVKKTLIGPLSSMNIKWRIRWGEKIAKLGRSGK